MGKPSGVTNMVQLKLYEVELEDGVYRLFLFEEEIPSWELYKLQLEWEDQGDLESGPLPPVAQVTGMEMVAGGVGNAHDQSEYAVEDFVRHQVYRTHHDNF